MSDVSIVSRQIELASLVTEARAPLLRPSSSCVRSLLRRSGRVVGRFAPSPQSGASSLNRVSTPLPPAPRSGRGVLKRGSRPVPAVGCRSSCRPAADRWRSRAAEGKDIARPGAPHASLTPPSPTRPHRGLAQARLRDGTALVCAVPVPVKTSADSDHKGLHVGGSARRAPRFRRTYNPPGAVAQR